MSQTGQSSTTEQPAENQIRAIQAVRAWLHDPTTQTGFHLACPYNTGASMILRLLVSDIGADHVVVTAPTGREAASAEKSLGVSAQTLHRLVYATRKDAGATTRFVPRGDGPLWAPETRLVIAVSAQRMKARDIAHLLSPGKRVLLVADPNDPMTPKDAFLAEREPDHTVIGPQMRQRGNPEHQASGRLHRPDAKPASVVDNIPESTSGRVMDAVERWLETGPSGTWLRLNPDDHDGRVGALAAAIAQRLPDAAVLGTTKTLPEGPAFLTALTQQSVTVDGAQRANRAGQPLLVLSETGTLLAPSSLAQFAARAPVVHVTRSGPTGPVCLSGFAGEARHLGLVTLTRTETADGLAVEAENGTTVRIVATRNDYATGLMAGEVFARTPES